MYLDNNIASISCLWGRFVKKKSVYILAITVIVLGIIALSVYLSRMNFDTTLEFQVRDAVSGNWIWDSTIGFQDRVIRGFYQSDKGPIDYQFTHLETGNWDLKVSAPAYLEVTIPVTIKKGANRLDEPIELIGFEIPDFDHFIIFEEKAGGDTVIEIRPVGTDGRAVKNHPCIDLWIGCRISEQLRNGLYTQEPIEKGSERGKELFTGEIEWQWDPAPETTFRYSARIHGSRIRNHGAPYMVIDYLLILPDSRKITRKEVSELMKQAPPLQNIKALTTYLDEYEDKLYYNIVTSWNVEGAAK